MSRFKKVFRTPQEYIATQCGHRTYGSGKVCIGGKEVDIWLEFKNNQPEWCLLCIARMARVCADCGRVIVPYSFVETREVEMPKESALCTSNGKCMTCLKCGPKNSKPVRLRFVPGPDGVGVLKNMQSS